MSKVNEELTSVSPQLALMIGLRDDATFDNFFAGSNQDLINALLQQLTEHGEMCVYVWGAAGSGTSHLLQAACHHAESLDKTSFYLDLSQYAQYDPAMLQGLESFDLVVLDAVHQIGAKKAWEEAIFHLYNRLREANKRILVSGNAAPLHLSIELPDLRSRLGWGQIYQCHKLNDAQKIDALKMRALVRGFELSDVVANYLLRHCARDMHSLFELLNKLDSASLALQRKLTIPLVKKVLET